MKNIWLKKGLIIGVLLWNSLAAYGISLNQSGLARVCEVDGQLITAHKPPDFSSTACENQPIARLNPQDRLLWVAVDLELDVKALQARQPLGLFLSGKTSSQAYLNGQLIGNNGQPGVDAKHEQAGLMDAVFHVHSEALKSDSNQLLLLLSAHHGILKLSQPINSLSLGTYQRPNNAILRYYWPSLLPFGVLLLGFFYLSMVAVLNRMPRHVLLLPLMALFAGTQLFVEVSRGLFTYSYPFHDYRLLLILFCSLGFGLSLLAYVLKLLPIKKPFCHWLLLAGLLLIIIIGVRGFDYKSILAIVFPVTLALVYLSRAWYLGLPQARFVALLLSGFFLMVSMSAYSFIDTVYYYFVAMLIFLLMAQQAKQASLTKQLQLKFQARADQLQQVIDQHTLQNSTDKLEIRSAGKVEWVMIKDLAYCKGAGDYVELVLLNGEVKLFHGSITELCLRLPTTFLKTHRSYLVNTTLITALERSPSGAGHLVLAHGDVVPVSKRVMPQIREKLS